MAGWWTPFSGVRNPCKSYLLASWFEGKHHHQSWSLSAIKSWSCCCCATEALRKLGFAPMISEEQPEWEHLGQRRSNRWQSGSVLPHSTRNSFSYTQRGSLCFSSQSCVAAKKMNFPSTGQLSTPPLRFRLSIVSHERCICPKSLVNEAWCLLVDFWRPSCVEISFVRTV